MKTQDLHLSTLEYKWQADLFIDRLDFYYDAFQKAINEVFFDKDQISNEEEYITAKTRIEQHLIASNVYLFQSDCYDLIDWVVPYSLESMIDINHDLPQLDYLSQTKRILLKKSSELTKDEKMFCLYYRTIFCLGLLIKYEHADFDPNFRLKQFNSNNEYLKQAKRLIEDRYNKLKDIESKANLDIKIDTESKYQSKYLNQQGEVNTYLDNDRYLIIKFNSSVDQKKALIYFSRINKEVFENSLFENNQTYKNFIESLKRGKLVIFEYRFNPNFTKGIVMEIFNLAKAYFKTSQTGPFAFIKNSGLFYFNGYKVKSTNWTKGNYILKEFERKLKKQAQEILSQTQK